MGAPTAEFSESQRAVLIAPGANPSSAPNEKAQTQVYLAISDNQAKALRNHSRVTPHQHIQT